MALSQDELNRMFSNAFSPIDTLGRGQLVLAENRLRRQEVLNDAARRLFERTEELKAQQKFAKEQAEAARESSSTDRALDRAQQARLAKESREAQIDYLETQRKLIEKTQEKEREEARKLAKENRERSTRTYTALRKERDQIAKQVENLKTVPLTERNKWVRELAQKYGASKALLDSAFDPKSATDISGNLSRLGKNAANAAADLEARESAYLDRNAEDLRFKQSELIGLNNELRALVRDVDLGIQDTGTPPPGPNAAAPVDLKTVIDTIVRENSMSPPQVNAPEAIPGIIPQLSQAGISAARSVASPIVQEARNVGSLLFGGQIAPVSRTRPELVAGAEPFPSTIDVTRERSPLEMMAINPAAAITPAQVQAGRLERNQRLFAGSNDPTVKVAALKQALGRDDIFMSPQELVAVIPLKKRSGATDQEISDWEQRVRSLDLEAYGEALQLRDTLKAEQALRTPPRMSPYFPTAPLP